MLPLLIAIVALLVVAIVLIILFRPTANNDVVSLNTKLDDVFKRIDTLTFSLKEDARTARQEQASTAAQSRHELSENLSLFRKELGETLGLITEQNRTATDGIAKTLEQRLLVLTNKLEESAWKSRESITTNLKEFSAEQQVKTDELKRDQKELNANTIAQLERLTQKTEEKLTAVNEQAKADGHLMRTALDGSFKGFRETFTQSMESMNNLQKDKFAQMEQRQAELVQTTGQKLEGIRETVDEKLQKTLNERLGHAFKQVGDQLESV